MADACAGEIPASEKKVKQGVDKLAKAYKTHAAGALEEYESPMSLAEFACKEHAIQARTLEAFVNEYKCRGEKLVAAGMHSMSNDRYYGQSLVLNAPFRLLEDFLSTETDIVEKVPAHYRHFAIALHRAPSFWGDDRAIEEQMALEAHSTARINTIPARTPACSTSSTAFGQHPSRPTRLQNGRAHCMGSLGAAAPAPPHHRHLPPECQRAREWPGSEGPLPRPPQHSGTIPMDYDANEAQRKLREGALEP